MAAPVAGKHHRGLGLPPIRDETMTYELITCLWLMASSVAIVAILIMLVALTLNDHEVVPFNE
ncbi:hypothetical protein AL485_15900 [Serratia liquefaciens]|nr:hypothetical protein AL485_15900 [Serratia liquefaciens]